MKKVTQIRIGVGEVLEVLDSSGNVLYRTSEPVSKGLEISLEELDVPNFVDDHIIMKLGLDKLEESIQALYDFMNGPVDVHCGLPMMEGSNFKLVANFQSDYLIDVVDNIADHDPLKRFVNLVSEGVVYFKLDINSDPFLSILTSDENFFTDNILYMASYVYSNFDDVSVSLERLLFKRIYESEQMKEFVGLYEKTYACFVTFHKLMSSVPEDVIRKEFPYFSDDDVQDLNELIKDEIYVRLSNGVMTTFFEKYFC